MSVGSGWNFVANGKGYLIMSKKCFNPIICNSKVSSCQIVLNKCAQSFCENWIRQISKLLMSKVNQSS